MIITKKQIIEAIECEPLELKGGWFFKSSTETPYILSTVTNKTQNLCQVCTVGAVFRSISDKVISNSDCYRVCGTYFTEERGGEHSIESLLNEGNYLQSLSARFEYLYSTYKMSQDELRSEMINFVECFFPKQISVPL